MRDLIITAFVLGCLPKIIKQPYWGLLMWIWLSLMNPHRLAYGFAYSLPFAQITAIAMLLGLLFKAGTLYRFPLNGVSITMLVFMAWLGVSPLFPFDVKPNANEFYFWSRALKIMLMVLATFLVVGTRDEVDKLVAVLAGSVAFYGVKGGLFVLATGGSYKVFGPASSFIEDNNTMALALVMVVPLLRYLQIYARRLWARRLCLAAMVLCTISAVGSYSRGALLALGAMGLFLWIKGRNRGITLILLMFAVPAVFLLMPAEWTDRMSTIKTYDEDRSAQGRINAWWMAWNLAKARFPLGGGFEVWEPSAFAAYSPVPEYVHAAHSIYFQVLGEHGFVGLFLFLCIFIAAFRTGRSVVVAAGRSSELAWAGDLAKMCQVSLIAYAVGGAFLSLSYYDFPYYIAAVLVVLKRVVTTLPAVVLPRVVATAPDSGSQLMSKS